ncbi:MAG: metal-dependent transcriptional regulator [Armatimonadota bacterium]|nr:metal-dependent transcriptional regulator [Armatimonadota bacterium]
MSDTVAVTAAGAEYLEWVYRLSKEKGTVLPLDLARSLKVSPPSVTAMLKRLAAAGLIEYRTHAGILLTESGRQVAARIVRRHGLIERLLIDVLGIPWETADEVACQLEHYLTEEVEERLAAFLGNPTTCPHGQFIDLESPDHSRLLTELAPGEEGWVARFTDEDTSFLNYVSELGMRPGARVRVTSRQPFNGPLMVAVDGEPRAIGREAAEKVRVEAVTPVDTASVS